MCSSYRLFEKLIAGLDFNGQDAALMLHQEVQFALFLTAKIIEIKTMGFDACFCLSSYFSTVCSELQTVDFFCDICRACFKHSIELGRDYDATGLQKFATWIRRAAVPP
jgi:hypothetical protein